MSNPNLSDGNVLEMRRNDNGEMFFQCACCNHLPMGERPTMSFIKPETVSYFPLAASRFVRQHVPNCPGISQGLRDAMGTNDVVDAILRWHASVFVPSLPFHPTAYDPVDPAFRESFYSVGDEALLTPAHVLVLRDVLEMRRTRSGKVFFQCACCSHRRNDRRASMHAIAPQRVGHIHRAVIRFVMNHVPRCADIPTNIKAAMGVKAPVSSQVKKNWTVLADEKGLRNSGDGNFIVFHNEIA